MRSFLEKKCRLLLFLIPTFLCGVSVSQTAWAALDVSVRKTGCDNNPTCFPGLPELYSWIKALPEAAKPNAENPLFVDIGPGVFAGAITMTCPVNGQGFVSYRGSGRGTTTIGGGAFFGGCLNIVVSDMTLDVTTWENGIGNAHIGVWFIGSGGGSSSWTNVEIIGNRAAWYDSVNAGGLPCSSEEARQRHQFFSSTLKLSEKGFDGGVIDVFFSTCGDIGMWGSEILLNIGSDFSKNGVVTRLTGVLSGGDGNRVRLFGTNVRMLGAEAATARTPVGLYAICGGEIWMSSGEVAVKHNRPNTNVIGALADGKGSFIFTGEASFDLGVADSGVATRVKASTFVFEESNVGQRCPTGITGVVESTFQWPATSVPPMYANGKHLLVSLNGQDSYYETDCPADTKCAAVPGSGDLYPHLMVYSLDCTGTTPETGPWFDTVNGECRGM